MQLTSIFQENLEQLRALRIKFPQADTEFSALIERVQELQPRIVVEIGTREGGSLWMLSQYLPEGATVISIDLVNGPWGRVGSCDKKRQVADDLRQRGFEVHLLEMDSHAPETVLALQDALYGRYIDFLFLDGDHSEAGVRSDWEMYTPFVRPGGMVAFHDVGVSDEAPQNHVRALWNELKLLYRHEEFSSFGVLWMPERDTPKDLEVSGNDIPEPVLAFTGKVIKPDTFAYTSPYGGLWVQNFYETQAEDLLGSKVIKEADFRQKLQSVDYLPELMVMHNFIVERAGIISLCREMGINTVHTEDGFFPHYGLVHADPLGFCWESSLTRMIFRECSQEQRQRASHLRAEWLQFAIKELPPKIRRPFVFWPLQLTGDKVNKCGLNVSDWTALLRHFRACLPQEYQLVIKEHPRSKAHDNAGINELLRELPNIHRVPRDTDLKTLLQNCSAVAGVNSTVLYEARLLFQKPVYAYGQSWFTNHTELFMPVRITHPPRELSRLDQVDDNRLLRSERLDDYTDWFTAQLLARQVTHAQADSDPAAFKARVQRFSYQSYIAHGEAIFD